MHVTPTLLVVSADVTDLLIKVATSHAGSHQRTAVFTLCEQRRARYRDRDRQTDRERERQSEAAREAERRGETMVCRCSRRDI